MNTCIGSKIEDASTTKELLDIESPISHIAIKGGNSQYTIDIISRRILAFK